MAHTISSLGLVLDIVGAVMLFKFGLPPDFDPLGRSFLITSTTHDDERAKGDRYRFWGRFGLVLMILGFAGQLAGTWLQ
jgi:hypothetical protein